MKKDKDKDKKTLTMRIRQKEKKELIQLRDCIPQNLLESLVPQFPIKIPHNQSTYTFTPPHIPSPPLEEWEYKTPEEINKEIEEDPANLFDDENHIIISSNLPLSLINITENNVEWVRPNIYVLNYYLDRQIQILYPKKNYITTRELMKNYHIKIQREKALNEEINKNKNQEQGEEEEEEENIDFFLKDDEEMRKQNMYKELLSILSKQYDYKVVNTQTQLISESLEENSDKKEDFRRNKKRKESRRQTNEVSKKSNKNIISELADKINKEESNKKYTTIIKPNNIFINNFINDEVLHNTFYSWLSSLFQLIIDLKIPDIETGQSIFSNIYPQKDGIPIYNPKGKYIIKLYQHGKARKIIIDDRIPCNRNSEYILPQCEKIEEIWPALFLKALIKLNNSKIRHPSYCYKEEYMDSSIIYSLTGMQIITLDLNSKLINIFKQKFPIINEENMKNKKEKMYIGLYNSKKTKSMKFDLTKSYFDIQQDFDYKNQRSGIYINNLDLQGKKIVPKQRGEKIVLRARERSNSIIANQKLKNKKSESHKAAVNFLVNNVVIGNKKKNEKAKKEEVKENTKLESNKENDNKLKNNNNNNSIIFQRSKKKRQTQVAKDVTVITGEAKRKNKNTELMNFATNIIFNFLYSVDDFFCNDDFNMKRLIFLDFSDLLKEIQDMKVEFKRLPFDQKKQYLIDRKKLKLKKLEEKNQRINSLKQPGKIYNLVRIINQCSGVPKLDYFSEYSTNNIEIAKKCLLNKWVFPPPSIFEYQFSIAAENQKKLRELRKLEDVVVPDKKKKNIDNNKPIGLFTWTKEMYEELIGGNETLKLYEGKPKIPYTSKIEDGGWMEYDETCKCFNKILIVQNTKLCYKENLFIDNSWNNFQSDEFQPLQEYEILLLLKNYIDEILSEDDIDKGNKKKVVKKVEKSKNKKGEEENNDSDVSMISNINQNGGINSSILIIFEPYNEDFKLNKTIKEVYYPYISFDICEKDTNDVIQKNIVLNKFYSFYYFSNLSKDKEYYVKMNGIFTPFGYNFQIFSEFYKIQHISNNTFLKFFRNFQEFNTIVQTGKTLEKNKKYILSKISFNTKDSNLNNIQFKIDVKNDFNYLKKYINVYLEKEEPFNKKEIEIEKLFDFDKTWHHKYYQLYKNNTNNKNNNEDEEFFFVFYIQPDFDLVDTQFSITILYNDPNISFKEIENIEPFELIDIYYKNKDSILFSYFIYPSEKIYTSLDINFYHIKKINENNKNINPENIQLIPLNEDENYHIKLELYQLTKEPSLEFVDNALKFSYSNQGVLVTQWKFTNSISISNIVLIGDVLPELKKKKNKPLHDSNSNNNNDEDENNKKIFPYVLLCYIDVQKLSDLKIPIDLGFVIRVYSSNNLGFIKDRTKEEHEKKLKQKWEENDVGRSVLAVKSRKRFLLSSKMKRKEKLDENEIKILKEKRLRRTASEIDHTPILAEETKNNNIKIKQIKKNVTQNDNLLKNIVNKKNNNSASKLNLREDNTENTNDFGNDLNKNAFNIICKKSRPLSMENIFGLKRPVSNCTKAKYIINFYDYSCQNRTIYLKKDVNKVKDLKRSRNPKKEIFVADEKYREKMRSMILNRFEESENQIKKRNEMYNSSVHELIESINNCNKNLNEQRRSQSMEDIRLFDKRQTLHNMFKRKYDIKRDLKMYIDECNKILENFENRNVAFNKKNIGPAVNYEEYLKTYKTAIELFGNDDEDAKNLFDIVSKIKEKELKMEYDRVKIGKDRNKDTIIKKIIEDIETNKWKISEEFLNLLKNEKQT